MLNVTQRFLVIITGLCHFVLIRIVIIYVPINRLVSGYISITARTVFF